MPYARSKHGGGALYGSSVPGRIIRWTPWGRAKIRHILHAHLDIARSANVSAHMIESLESELRH